MNNIRHINALISETYRLILCGQEGAANKSLAKIYDELLKITPMLSAEKIQTLSQLLQVMLDAQQRRDMIYLADIMKFEIPKILS
ncbi:hypothetical protein [Colwellia sp. Bg11-12]|uniref:hypothetical protein n=1 Tax=Colwellia sp. Bg11-12 TaxID=2759817 RepID=UPI0015F509E3|nr:hypothetical protein [Colwellia sp. Bg11-12]MBA6264350.1 hypothetical protein [Colwellia sp. Bg11-12]